MRILHTADWHLADRLGRIDRGDDLRRAVERVAGFCVQENVDVLLVAGDLFSELASAEALRDTVRHLQTVFSPFLRDGGTIVTLTGNHDKENFCQTLRLAMSLAAPIAGTPGELVPPGRLYLATEPSLIRLEDKASGVPIQFLLMPYPTPTRYLTTDADQRYQGLEEKNRLLMAAFTRVLHDLRQSEFFSDDLPAVLAAHIGVRGSELPTLFRLSEQEDVLFSEADLPTGFAYVALGHIHRAQFLHGQTNVRYSGSIEKMDLGESSDHKGVVVFNIGPEGIQGEPRVLPMESTPVYEVTVLNPSEDIPRLRAKHPDAARDLVRIRCTYTAGKDNREEVLRELEEIFPRWYDRQITESGTLGPSLVVDTTRPHSFEETVRGYLEQELINEDEPMRRAVLARVETLMREMQL